MKFRMLLLVGLLFSFVLQTKAVPAYPYPVKVSQPDGTSLTIILRGDEFHHYYTTEDGFLLVKGKNSIFNYARLNTRGDFEDTGVKANDARFRSVSERTFVSKLEANPDLGEINKSMRSKRALASETSTTVTAPARFPKIGSPRSLVILVNFSDLTYVTPAAQNAFTDLLNLQGYSANGGTGSAKDYFRDNSMGTFTPQFDVVGPFTLPQTYKYYGENDSVSKFDKNPVQLIVDACTAASNAGVNFATYDTDGDKIVDNVFVYFAGHNEAEHAGADRVWPHRWGIYPTSIYSGGNYTGTVASVTFNGVRVMDYACTSELRGSSGTDMAGIGTFTHEFGHVIGLADMYATNGATHFTLSAWNIMDAGAYLNLGRTPPAYNAFERFQLGFMKPTLLQNYPQNNVLGSLTASNQAFLISPTENHNLTILNPSPTEFFLLENRQKTGWDSFLPGKGMLIYRINYNQNDWDYNQPNNDPAKMGVDIMEADKVANTSTLGGDPFPGVGGVTFYDMTLRSGEKLYKRISNITETNGQISFNVDKIAAIETNPSSLSFTSLVNNTSGIQNVIVTTKNLTGAGLQLSIVGNDSLMFTYNGNGTLPITGGEVVLSFTPTSEGQKTASLKVTDGEVVKLVSLTGVATVPPLAVPVVPATISSIVADTAGFTAIWNATADAESYELKVYTKNTDGTQVSVVGSPFNTTETYYYVSKLIPETDYFYVVSGKKGTQVSQPSAEVGPVRLIPTGLGDVFVQKLQLWMYDGKLLFNGQEGEVIEAYSATGQKILHKTAVSGVNDVTIQTKGVVILKVGDRVGKIVL